MMRPSRAVSLAAVLGFGLVLLASTAQGCGYDWSFPGDGAPTGDAGIADASPVPPTDGPGDDASPVPPIPPTGSCGSSTDCATGTYCRFPDRQCGTGQKGTCEPVEKNCTLPDWRCGCSGSAYKHACDQTEAKRDDVSPTSACSGAPAGYFRCGYRLCQEKLELCMTTSAGGIGEYKCVGFDGCAAQDCTCPAVTKLGCPGGCSDVKVGQVSVKCS